ncbi:glycosyltransferase [Halomonas janggokensis]|uniref:Glycosyltransferase n=1 Tax=Vreelandella janggokensis TaxID=370767 RepID=A0ABT4IR31_9GAMM|nr:glycosyltransferase [Halomonas janggokensis]MCZ0926129.1 glycosyltransferase [Halomonas janggokensis]MCZ0931196.1 glycosyltransferase [Halomonas janggokensis]
MPQRRRPPLNSPLSDQEVAALTHLANGNALHLQHEADREARLEPALTMLHSTASMANAQPGCMKVLMISDVYFPRVNGVSTSIASFRGTLERLGHSVTLICPDYPLGQVDEPGVLRIRSHPVPGDPEDRIMRYRDLLALTPQLAGKAFDVIHVHTPFTAHYAGIALGRRLGLPVVATYHTLFEAYVHHYIRWLPGRWLRFAARRLSVHQCQQLDALVAPSRTMQQAVAHYGVTTPITVIATGLALEAFCQPQDQRDFRAHYDLPSKARLLLYVGRAAFEKNIDFLIDMLPQVLAEHPTTRLIITGEGPAHASLVRRAQDVGVSDAVIFLGYLDRHGPLQAVYRAADVFVFASRTETQGMVLLEAMALGTPVVSTATMGTLDVLKEGEGCLIAEENHNDFATKVNQLLSDETHRAQLALRGQTYAASWHEDTKSAALVALYRRLAAERLTNTGKEVRK